MIPESVTSIGNRAFFGCKNLTSVTIPGSVISIGILAFFECKNLTSVTILEGVTSIGESAFVFCSSLTSVTIPESVTSIGQRAFKGCKSLASVTIPEGVTSIGAWAFCGCERLTSVTIPDSVTEIGEDAFDAGVELIRSPSETNCKNGSDGCYNAAMGQCGEAPRRSPEPEGRMNNMMKIHFEFEDQKATDLEQLNAMLGALRLQSLELENTSGYLQTVRNGDGELIEQRYGLTCCTLNCERAEDEDGLVYQMDTAVTPLNVEHEAFVKDWRERHPDRIVRIVQSTDFDDARTFLIVHHQKR